MSQRNSDIMREVVEWLLVMGRPFIWGGDFQVPPQELAKVGFRKKIRAAIIAPGTSTLRHSDRAIDYWIVSDALSPFIMDVDVDDSRISTSISRTAFQ